MTLDLIAALRLRNQRIIAATRPKNPEAVVEHLGAVQAQEYGPARWGLGLRMIASTTDASIAVAVDEGRILRTHVMRPTWHFVTPRDIRWMLQLTGAGVLRSMSSYMRSNGLDAKRLVRGTTIIERALRDGALLTRPELGVRLARSRMPLTGIPLALLTMYAEIEAVICSGPFRGKQLTYALLAKRAPDAQLLSRDEALGELATRYFQSHGPATLRDFMWWSGLRAVDARRAVEIAGAMSCTVETLTYWTVDRRSRSAVVNDHVRLLPIYDEYVVAYRDREAVRHGPGTIAKASGKVVTFQHALLVNGQVGGTWRQRPQKDGVVVEVTLLKPLTRNHRALLDQEAQRYARFLEKPVALTIR